MTTRCQPLVFHRSALPYRRESAAVCPWPLPKHRRDRFPTPSPLRRARSSGYTGAGERPKPPRPTTKRH